METITLPDGYNGHTAKFYTEILEEDMFSVKLQCAERGKEYTFRWCWKDEYKKIIKEDK